MFQEYWFLFLLALVWIVFAVVQDLRTREIANWLTFSFLAFVLAYRAIYSYFISDFSFFLFGIAGVVLFVSLGYALYYGKVIAGGDVKLLFGLGGIFPYNSLSELVYYGVGYIFLLFFVGMFYTLVYSVFLIRFNRKSFVKDFSQRFKSSRIYIFGLALVSLIIFYFMFSKGLGYSSFVVLIVGVMPLLLIYTKSIEATCMIKRVSPGNLTEGDWLERDVSVNGKTIKKSVHGLDIGEIKLLRKYGKKVLIKEGVPFTPAFLISLVIFALFLLRNSAF